MPLFCCCGQLIGYFCEASLAIRGVVPLLMSLLDRKTLSHVLYFIDVGQRLKQYFTVNINDDINRSFYRFCQCC